MNSLMIGAMIFFSFLLLVIMVYVLSFYIKASKDVKKYKYTHEIEGICVGYKTERFEKRADDVNFEYRAVWEYIVDGKKYQDYTTYWYPSDLPAIGTRGIFKIDLEHPERGFKVVKIFREK